MSNYTKRAVRGAGIIFFFSLISALLGYVFRMLIARGLSVEQYGLFWAVVTFILFIGMLKKLGLDATLTKFIAELRVKKQFKEIKTMIMSIFSFMFLTSLAVGFVLIAFSNFIAVHYFHNPEAALLLKIFAVAIMLRPFSHMFAYIFLGFHRIFYYSLFFDFTRMVTIVIVALVGLNISKTAVAPSLGYVIAPIIVCAISFPLFIKNVFPNFFKIKAPWFRKKTTKKIFRFSIPVMMRGFGSTILADTSTLMLTFFSGVIQVGYYNVAMPTAMLITKLFRSVVDIIVPFSSELWAKNYKKHLQEGVLLIYRYMFLIVLPISITMLVFSDQIITVLFGSAYLPASVVLKILAVSVILSSMTSINGTFMVGIGKPIIYTRIILITAVFNAVFNLALIPKFGILGAAIATSTSYLLMFILTLRQIRKIIQIKIPLFDWFKNIIAALLSILSAYILKNVLFMNVWVEAVIVIVVSLMVYVVSVFVFRITTIREIRDIVRRVRQR